MYAGMHTSRRRRLPNLGRAAEELRSRIAAQTRGGLGRELGVVEWHVHFSGEADDVVGDLSGSLLH